jgi:DNA-binding SARP family transcriptional activator/tetratricopeptide (TPR) repeat protein
MNEGVAVVELRILGPPQLLAPDGKPIEALSRQPKRVALLSFLALTSAAVLHRRDKLCALFWPKLDELHARNALSQALHVLRATLGEAAIVTRGNEEVGINAALVWCDAVAFNQALDAGQTEDALALYFGDLLDGLFIVEAPEFERWLEQERERMRRRVGVAASQAANDRAIAHDWAGALESARRALEVQPYDEAAARHLIRLLDETGDRAGAVREYREFARRLKEDLDVEPSPETAAVLANVRSRDRDLQTSVPATGANSPQPRRRRLHLMGAGLLFAAAAIGWMLSSDEGLAIADPSFASPSPNHIAVFPFNVEASPEFEYLGEGVMDVLSDAIDELGELRRIQPLALMSRFRRADVRGVVGPEQAGPIAERLGARRYILGNVVQLGGEFSISASLFDLTMGSRPLAEASVQGRPEQLAELLTELTQSLVRDVSLGAGARLDHVGTLRAANFRAFKLYLQGEALLRRGWYDSAAAKLREAVVADSTFAVAWYRLGLVLGLTQSFGEEGDNYASLARAARFSGLSRRDRALVDAWRAHFRGRPEVAERLAREVVGAYPDDVEAWHLLGLTRMWYAWQRGRSYTDARTALERALLIDPRHPDALYHAFALAIIEARYRDADSLASLSPKGVGVWAVAKRGLLIFTLGNHGDQRRFMSRLDNMDDQTMLAVGSNLANHSDSMLAARRVFTRLAAGTERSDWARAQAALFLAHLDAARGRWREARDQFERASQRAPTLAFTSYAWLVAMPFFNRPQADIALVRDSLQGWEVPRAAEPNRLHPQILPDILALPDELRPWIKDYLLGLLHARLGETASAERFAVRLERATEPRDTVGLRHDLALEIRALVAMQGGRPADALRLLEQARMAVATSDQAWYPRYYTRPLGRFLRAEALRELGRYEEALGWYSTFCDKYGTEYVYRPVVFLRQAEIHERKEPQRAREYYRRYLARWQDADPEYQAVVRAIERRVH